MRRFEPAVLAEIIREGEARLNTQLQIANAADGRALSIAGFETTAATAALGAGIALAGGDHKDLWLTILALIFSVVMVATAMLAVSTVRPARFSVPGNNPKNWLPDQWLGRQSGDYSLIQARVEQAGNLARADNLMRVKRTKCPRRRQIRIVRNRSRARSRRDLHGDHDHPLVNTAR